MISPSEFVYAVYFRGINSIPSFNGSVRFHHLHCSCCNTIRATYAQYVFCSFYFLNVWHTKYRCKYFVSATKTYRHINRMKHSCVVISTYRKKIALESRIIFIQKLIISESRIPCCSHTRIDDDMPWLSSHTHTQSTTIRLQKLLVHVWRVCAYKVRAHRSLCKFVLPNLWQFLRKYILVSRSALDYIRIIYVIIITIIIKHYQQQCHHSSY